MPGTKAGTMTRKDDQLWRCKRHKRIECDLLLSLPLNSSFLDVGAHLGDTVLTVALRARAIGRTDLRFFAFEPARRKCDFIRETVERNGLKGVVTVVQACVGDVGREDIVRRIDGARSTRYRKDNLVDKYDGRVVYVVKGGREEAGGGNTYDDDDEGNDDECQNDDADDNVLNSGDAANSGQREDDDAAAAAAAAAAVESDASSSSSSSSDSDDESLRMITLDSMYDVLHPVGFFHLDVEGWESRVLSGASRLLRSVVSSPSTSSACCYVVAEVWEERNARIGRDGVLTIRGFSPVPIKDIEVVMREHGHFVRGEDIVDQERNLFFSAFATPDNGRRRRYEVYYPVSEEKSNICRALVLNPPADAAAP